MRLLVSIMLLVLIAGCSTNSNSKPPTQPGGAQHLPKEVEGNPESALPKKRQ